MENNLLPTVSPPQLAVPMPQGSWLWLLLSHFRSIQGPLWALPYPEAPGAAKPPAHFPGGSGVRGGSQPTRHKGRGRQGCHGTPVQSQDSSRTDAQSRASGSACRGQTHRAFADAPAPLLQVLRMNWRLPMVVLLWARLPRTGCPGCWLWLWVCHMPEVLLQAGSCWAGWSVINCKPSSSLDLFSSDRSPCCCFQAYSFLLASSCSPSSIPELLSESAKAAT